MQVVYVAGASHSGSTLVGCILGSCAEGPLKHFHVGEIHAFFKQRLYGDSRAAAKTRFGKLWDQVDPSVGYKSAYPEVERVVPEIQTLVDSSKNPRNLEKQIKAGIPRRYGFRVIITYRPFQKIWRSDERRQKMVGRIVQNIGGYRDLLRLVDAYAIPYAVVNTDDLVREPERVTRRVCERMGIPYFQGKERYWEFEHCHLYGSGTQRRQIDGREVPSYDVAKAGESAVVENRFLARADIRAVERRLADEALG